MRLTQDGHGPDRVHEEPPPRASSRDSASALFQLACCGLAWLLLGAACPAGSAGKMAADLAELRRQSAVSYCDPATHLSLARAHHDAGDRLLAFGIVDHLKRYRSSPASFRREFHRAFQDEAKVDASDAAVALLLEQHLKDMKDVSVLTKLGHAYAAGEDWERAQNFFERAAALQPDLRAHVDLVVEAMNRRGRNQAAEQRVVAFVASHPDGVGARVSRIEELVKTDAVAARRLIDSSLAKYPKEGTFHFFKGQQLVAEQRLSEAQQSLVEAARLLPESARTQGAVAGFFLSVSENLPAALDFYLSAYFKDPNFHDGQYVDDRIRTLSRILGSASVNAAIEKCAGGNCLVSLLSHDNPAIVQSALRKAAAHYEPEIAAKLVDLLSHPHPGVRSGAMLVLKKNGGSELDAVVRRLMKSEDLTALGLSCYLAVARWGSACFEDMRGLLAHEAELVRFDAMAALALEGGQEGQALLEQRLSRESSPVLRSLGAQLLSSARSAGERSGR